MADLSSIDDCQSSSSFRVLVVEDYEPFRQFVCEALKERPEFEVICHVAGGLEAVHRAKELHPNLILLDIGLPTLNGIDAARRIRRLSPKSKIVFVSQELSPDVVHEAFGLGATGYVAKTHAGMELLAAVEAARQGRRFVGSGVQVFPGVERDFSELTREDPS